MCCKWCSMTRHVGGDVHRLGPPLAQSCPPLHLYMAWESNGVPPPRATARGDQGSGVVPPPRPPPMVG